MTNIQALPLKYKRERNKNISKLFLCAAITIIITALFDVVFAEGAFEDILTSMVSGLFEILGSLVCGLFQLFCNFFINFLAVDVGKLETYGLLKSFEWFGEGVRALATTLASAIFIFQLGQVFFGPALGKKDVNSIGGIIARGLIFIPLTYFIKDICLIGFKQVQIIYNEFILMLNADAHFQTTGGNIGINLFEQMFLAGYEGGGLSLIGLQPLGPSAGNTVTSSAAADSGIAILTDIGTTLMVCIICCFILFNFIKLLLETVQRFVALIVYTYLSPLAMACGTGANSIDIAKKFGNMYLSSLTLWVLNVWSVGIAVWLINSYKTYAQADAAQLLLWCALTYGFIKVAQQVDDIFMRVGALNTRFSGSMFDDLASISALAHNILPHSNKKGGGSNGKNSNGSSKDKPTGPKESGSITKGNLGTSSSTSKITSGQTTAIKNPITSTSNKPITQRQAEKVLGISSNQSVKSLSSSGNGGASAIVRTDSKDGVTTYSRANISAEGSPKGFDSNAIPGGSTDVAKIVYNDTSGQEQTAYISKMSDGSFVATSEGGGDATPVNISGTSPSMSAESVADGIVAGSHTDTASYLNMEPSSANASIESSAPVRMIQSEDLVSYKITESGGLPAGNVSYASGDSDREISFKATSSINDEGFNEVVFVENSEVIGRANIDVSTVKGEDIALAISGNQSINGIDDNTEYVRRIKDVINPIDHLGSKNNPVKSASDRGNKKK